jgi:peptidoglycan/xylan/chitin deacetylase (PgdA/CDA1 family)
MPLRPYLLPACFVLFSCGLVSSQSPTAWLRINQLGYLEQDTKVAVLVSKAPLTFDAFELRDALTHEPVFRSDKIRKYGAWAAFSEGYRLDFSAFGTPGAYYVQVQDVRSPVFRIGHDVYEGAADFILRYMRQQRSGFNPYLNDSCHTADGFIIYHPDRAKDSTRIDVSGGWHDASDYLQYLPTSANATFQLLFAYRKNPGAFGDAFGANGRPGANGIPDVLDEAKWGLDWLLKMNPSPGEYYNQIADDRDHKGFRLPTLDSVRYGAPDGSLARPVYYLTGEPQGAFKHKNRTKGAASSAGKFASAYALGAQVLQPFYPEYAAQLPSKALDAYRLGRQKPGYTQTAPCRAPYFYEEENYVDDMELAAAQLDALFPGQGYREQAGAYGKAEPVTPWMGSDTARHYQWYPFVNLGHYFLAETPWNPDQPTFLEFMRRGVDSVYQRGKTNPFLYGVPFIWCSNNLNVAIYTQARLYRERSGDARYREMEIALRDWLFGCNPWGTSMICGLPASGVSPRDPHSAFTHLYNYPIDGGLVDGPIYGSIWNKLIGIQLFAEDEFAAFQSPLVVYHDDYGDYSSNEPTMDGTASLSYMLSALEMEGRAHTKPGVKDRFGALVRGDTTQKVIHLVFTGHEYAEGAESILGSLKKAGIPASFFVTGDFCRLYPETVRRLKQEGHYVGAHSDKHLLYCDWTKRDSLLVSKTEFMADLRRNFEALATLGIPKNEARMFIPPYEWYNDSIVAWSGQAGLTLFNYSPGTLSHADYTTPKMKNYRSSKAIYRSILTLEEKSGLNGFYLLMHIGAGKARRDKFYKRLEELVEELKRRGYEFEGMNAGMGLKPGE